jgi:hypothetical protein
MTGSTPRIPAIMMGNGSGAGEAVTINRASSEVCEFELRGCLLCDDLIPSRTAVETLLERGFVPSRTVLLAFGIDEESGGHKVHYVLPPRLFLY